MMITTGQQGFWQQQHSGIWEQLFSNETFLLFPRNVLGTKNLSEILSDREAMGDAMHQILEVATDVWGVHVDRVEVKDVRLPQQMQRSMAAEAEAARDARAKVNKGFLPLNVNQFLQVINSEGEQKSAKALKEASDIMAQSPAALQLRYLQV